MKPIIFLLVLSVFGCNNKTKEFNSVPNQQNESNVVKQIIGVIDSSLYINIDSIVIISENHDTLVYRKEEFNDIITHFPILYNEQVDNPDISYQESGIFRDYLDSAGNEKHLTFGSEQGQDRYYILYAYFLKKKTGENKFSVQRNTLIKVYDEINNIFGAIQYGGTYFGHQYQRIIGYAEYSIYRYSKRQDFFTKEYDITKQKELYLSLLRQLINDEVSVDQNQPTQTEKDERKNELFQMVGNLDKLITDNFYLKMAQEFQYSHY